MNRHDTVYSEACRLARYAVRARQAGDLAAARRYETRALAMVEQAPRRSLAPRGRALGAGLALVAALTVLALPGVAQAAEPAKPRKPAVCAVYELAQTSAGRVAICLEGKRPRVFVSFAEVTVVDPDSGAPLKVVVGL